MDDENYCYECSGVLNGPTCPTCNPVITVDKENAQLIVWIKEKITSKEYALKEASDPGGYWFDFLTKDDITKIKKEIAMLKTSLVPDTRDQRIERLESALHSIVGRDSRIDASITSSGGRTVIVGDLGKIALDALEYK